MRSRALLASLALSAAMATFGVHAGEVNVTGIANTCNNCHGVQGLSGGGAMPSIGGQPAGYLKTVMNQYRSGERYNTVMGRLLKGYSEDEINALAGYFARQPWVSVGDKADDTMLLEGEKVYKSRCMGCHGAKGELGHDGMPRIGGQRAKFISLELQKYLDPAFKMPGQVMEYAVKGMTAREVDAVSAYLGNMK